MCFNHSRGWGCSSDSRVLAFKSDILGLIPYITLKKNGNTIEDEAWWHTHIIEHLESEVRNIISSGSHMTPRPVWDT